MRIRRIQMVASTTNILPAHRAAFNALVSGKYANFALFSCFINGQPGSAIVAINHDGEEYTLSPVFVSVAPGMKLADHDGNILQF
jgi:hypothetical protein